MRLMLIAMAAILVATAAQAAKLSSGTYVMQGGSYSIGVAEQDGTLVVTEPNKTSVYTPAADGSYHFTNPNNGITYGLRIVDDRTIEAFKPGNPGGAPTRLVLSGGASAGGAAPSGDVAERWSELASQYSAKIATDPANTQSWVACAGVAMKRSVASEAEANAYAREMAAMLRQMSAVSTPCPDVIRPSDW